MAYEIWRNDSKAGTSTTTSFNDTGLSPRTSYTYSVKAFDGTGEISAPSAPATATTLGGSTAGFLAIPATATAGSSVTISIRPGDATVAGDVSVFPWYIFDETTGRSSGIQIATVSVCPGSCTQDTSSTFPIPSNWTTGSYFFCVNFPETSCGRLQVRNDVVTIDPGQCSAMTLKGLSNDKLDVVFLADNFNAAQIDDFRAKTEEYKTALLSVTPFRENAEKINFWRVERQGPVMPEFSEISPGPDFWSHIVAGCGGADVVAVVEGPASDTVGVAFAGEMPPWLNIHRIYGGDTFVHEFGHAFANLGDEYQAEFYWENPELATRPNTDAAFCPKWCSGEPNMGATIPAGGGFSCWNAWQTFNSCIAKLGSGDQMGAAVGACWTEASDLHNGLVAGIETCDFGTGCAQGTGCFWNAKSTDLFRPTRESIMAGGSLSTGFNPPSQEAIRKKLDMYR